MSSAGIVIGCLVLPLVYAGEDATVDSLSDQFSLVRNVKNRLARCEMRLQSTQIALKKNNEQMLSDDKTYNKKNARLRQKYVDVRNESKELRKTYDEGMDGGMLRYYKKTVAGIERKKKLVNAEEDKIEAAYSKKRTRTKDKKQQLLRHEKNLGRMLQKQRTN